MVAVGGVMETSGTAAMEIEDGMYVVRVTQIEEDANGQFGPQLKWTFTIVEAIAGDEEVVGQDAPWQWSGQALTISRTHGPSKFYSWTKALFGGEIPTDFNDTDQLIGKTARASFVTEEGKRPKITALMPIKKKKVSAQVEQDPWDADE